MVLDILQVYLCQIKLISLRVWVCTSRLLCGSTTQRVMNYLIRAVSFESLSDAFHAVFKTSLAITSLPFSGFEQFHVT